MKKLMITGNVGKDPEVRFDPEGKQYATFSVAVSVGTKDNPKTDWIDVSCNGKLSDVVKMYVKKGTKVLVEGFPTVNTYINREGKPVGVLRLSANNLEMLSSREHDSQPEGEHEAPVYALPEHKEANGVTNTEFPDIPF